MKTIAFLLLLLLTVGCAKHKVINGKDYQPYGVFNTERRVDSVQYSIPPGGVIGSILLFETVIFPVYVVGWDLYQPEFIKH